MATRKGLATRPAAAAQVRRRTACSRRPRRDGGRARRRDGASVEGRFSYWDALLLATAAEAGCNTAISGDLAGDVTLGSIRVVKAFAGGGVSAAARALL